MDQPLQFVRYQFHHDPNHQESVSTWTDNVHGQVRSVDYVHLLNSLAKLLYLQTARRGFMYAGGGSVPHSL